MSTTEDTTLAANADPDPAGSGAQGGGAPADADPAAAPTSEATGGDGATGHRPSPPRLIPPPPGSRHGRRLVRMAQWGAGPLDRLNRLVFAVLGLVLAAAGVGVLLLHDGTISWTQPSVTYERWVHDAAGSVDLAAAIACAVCLVVLLLAGRWAVAQLRPVSDRERIGTIRLARGPRGRTNLGATTLAKAATTDLERRPGVASARVRIRAVKPHPRLQITVEQDLDADVEAVLAEVDGAIDNLVGALGARRDEAEAELRLRFARGARQPRAGRPGRVD